MGNSWKIKLTLFLTMSVWNSSSELGEKVVKAKHVGRSGSLNGFTLTLGVIHDPPYIIIQKNQTRFQLTGLDFEAFLAIAQDLQFNFHIKLIDDGYGELLENGSWTGLLGTIQRKEADVCLPSLSQTPLRGQVLDISAPISSSYSRFLARRPTATLGWTQYVAPFSLSIWFLTFVFLIVCSLAAALTDTFNSHQLIACKVKWQEFPRNWCRSLWFCICFISQKGVGQLPKKIPSRIILVSFAFFSLLFMGYYNSVIVAFLTVDSSKLPFDSLETLIEDDDYHVGYIRGSAYTEMFKKKPVFGDELITKLYDKVMQDSSNLVANNREGVLKVLNEKYVFLSWVEGIIPEIKNNSLEFEFMSGRFWLTSYGIGFQKGSPYVDEFSRVLLKLRETGCLDRLVEKYFPSLDLIKDGGFSSTQPLDIKRTLFLFISHIIGLVLALIAFTVEIIYPKLKKTI